jgi:hypothetical protein
MDIEIAELLDKLPKTIEAKWSYLETIGVAHRETIMANLLAFYFNPNEIHGLDDVFIKALLQTEPFELKEKKPSEIPSQVTTIAKDGFGWANVIVEDSTDDNKRLDILIETEKLVIAIEFKINHELNNPLTSYVSRVKQKCGKKETRYIVLTPYWKEPVGAALEGDTKFKQVIISHFIANVAALVKKEDKLTRLDAQQVMLYNDFINTIENRKIRVNMINEYVGKVEKGHLSHEKIEEAFVQFNQLKTDIENKTKELLKLLNKPSNPKFSMLSGSNNRIESVVYCTQGDTQTKVRLNLKGWTIEQWEKQQGNWKIKEDSKLNIHAFDTPITEIVKKVQTSMA